MDRFIFFFLSESDCHKNTTALFLILTLSSFVFFWGGNATFCDRDNCLYNILHVPDTVIRRGWGWGESGGLEGWVGGGKISTSIEI